MLILFFFTARLTLAPSMSLDQHAFVDFFKFFLLRTSGISLTGRDMVMECFKRI